MTFVTPFRSFVRSVRISEGLPGLRRKEVMMITIAYGFRYNLDESLIEAGMWSPYPLGG
jgi:hypothetical protein